MFKRASVVSASMADDMTAVECKSTERGDHVVVVETTESRCFLHLRRGMEASEVADGLRQLARTIEMGER